MDRGDDLWAAIRQVLPDAEELAADVAADLGDPPDDVRLSVLIGTIALDGQLGPEVVAAAAIRAELVRLQSAQGKRPQARLLVVDSLDELLAEARALQAKGSLDIETIVAIQRASGAIAARTNRPMVAALHRYAVTRRQIWEHCVAAMGAGRLDPDALARLGRFLLLWNELTSLAVTDGYRLAERDILARDVEARRSALQELLGVTGDDAVSEARLRRLALRHGLNPDREYLLVAISPIPEADPTLDQQSADEDHLELEVLAGRLGHLLGATAPGTEGVGAGIRLPAVLPLMGRIAVLSREDWAGLSRVPSVLDKVLGVVALADAEQPAWVAVCSRPINGVGSLARTYADLVDATRTTHRLGLRGWIPDPEQLALERLLLSNRHLADATVRRELGPLLADERFGAELIETLQAYFDSGENVTAAARRLHLATRTVGYRLEKIEALLGHRLDGESGRRLSTALMIHRLELGRPSRWPTVKSGG